MSYQRDAAPDAHCVANSHSEHTKEQSGLRLTFWTAPGPDHTTCIGTIELTTSKHRKPFFLEESVKNHYGEGFCYDRVYSNSHLTLVCKDYFRYWSLAVVAERFMSGHVFDFDLGV